jgi:hypothetical protein
MEQVRPKYGSGMSGVPDSGHTGIVIKMINFIFCHNYLLITLPHPILQTQEHKINKFPHSSIDFQ